MPLTNQASASPITATPENNILQSFSDATAGRSQQLYYGMATSDSSGVSYVLMRDAGTSYPTWWYLLDDGPGAMDIDFDITINKPTIFAGIGSIDFKIGYAGGANSTSTYITFNIIHYDGSTETSIGSVQSATYTLDADGSRSYKVKVNITRKLFGVGHILRLSCAATKSGGTRYYALYHNPGTAGNELKLWMPIVNLE
jgi:hypothetical protein